MTSERTTHESYHVYFEPNERGQKVVVMAPNPDCPYCQAGTCTAGTNGGSRADSPILGFTPAVVHPKSYTAAGVEFPCGCQVRAGYPNPWGDCAWVQCPRHARDSLVLEGEG